MSLLNHAKQRYLLGVARLRLLELAASNKSSEENEALLSRSSQSKNLIRI